MKYILDEEEYKNLVSVEEMKKRDYALDKARNKILKLADFDCIHKQNGRNNRGYCNGCPCDAVTSDLWEYSLWKLVCPLEKNYNN